MLLTVTSTVPADPDGAVAVILLSETTVKLAGLPEPKSTTVALVKPLPVIVTVFPPPTAPAPGDTPLTTGAPKVY